MKRTTTRHRRQLKRFFTENRRLFPFAGLFLAGVMAGVAVYRATGSGSALDRLLPVPPITDGWLVGLWQSGFSALVLLVALFLLGLWACGAPFILLVPLFHGLGLGLTEAYYYAQGDVGTVALLVMPVGLLYAVVLTMAGVESLRLSTGLSRRLLPSGEEGGLWDGFRLYGLRFLLFLAATLLVAGLDVALRLLLPQYL